MGTSYFTKAVLEPGVTGWIVAWSSNQLTVRLPQWPQLRVVGGQELCIAIDPQGGGFGLVCDSDPAKVQVCAHIEPDKQSEGKWCEWLLPFPPFERSG